jgi:hypothetical protein
MVNIKLYHIAWYTGTCDNGHGLTIIQFKPMVKKIYNYVLICLGSDGCFLTGTQCLNRGHSYGFANSIGHPRSG